ncbi:site-specific recombinase [Uliginosibacterium sp. H3]|uniref:Site-specific recombinase n=1 Tax=Uliginosibacterium silvisoli TaxID=3114758 RepID=A0ABU6JZM2_9RHOO|nr:site-specific recombinase [Uliginosibacterium sp. H3]
MIALHPLLEDIARRYPPGVARAEAADNDAAQLVQLMRHLRPARGEPTEQREGRIRLLIDVLRSRPQLAAGLREYLSSLLAARNHFFVYAESGILGNTGFFTELRQRIGNRLLPPALDPRFLRDLIEEVFEHSDDAEWLASTPRELWAELLHTIGFSTETPTAGQIQIRKEMCESLRVLTVRLAALGLEPDLVRYYPALSEYESPFLAQQREFETVIVSMQGALLGESDEWPDSAHADVLLQQCCDALVRIRKLSHEAGAAVRLSWHLTRAFQIIERMREMLALLMPSPREERVQIAFDFFFYLVKAECRRHSVRELVTSVTDLLSLQVTEHASKTGEHYVTRDRSEFYAMFRAAAGAGIIVGFMALIKMLIAMLHLPPLWEALGFSLNYGLGFVLVHLLGFTIATKQPAMTAATLAAALDPRKHGTSRVEEMSELIVQVCRSQFIAIAGNVLLAFLTSLGIAYAWVQIFGVPAASVEKARSMLHDLHPLFSMALPHAAIAGVCLFLSGLVTGYYDNKAIYNRVPDRLRRVRWLRRLLGEVRLERLAVYVEHNLGALAGNFIFGFMLGCMGTLGFLLGLPLDIRHVTFGAANLAYGLQALDFQVFWTEALVCAVGVILIGMTNLAVSFSLAMNVALKSRRVRFSDTKGLLRLLLRRFVRRPRDFFWPPKEAKVKEVQALEE